ncbi:cytochrome P450 [Xylariales sp. PMI_506]|nr:cytochrome P450 [Xylariales sp. PMI_506]
MADTGAIPEPPSLPLIGHITAIDQADPLGSFMDMAEKYGDIYQLRLPGRTVVVCSSHALVDELCDEKRFKKVPAGALKEIRDGVHDGLFTAYLEEPNWGIAHRVLMPAFGPLSIRGMFDEMHDVATQLTMKWARYGSSSPIMVTDDFTRLALDTLALCAMGFRFNSFYTQELHPFIDAMGDFLVESSAKTRRPPLPAWFYRSNEEKFQSDIAILRKTAQDVLDERKSGNSDRKDLLAAMLKGIDPKNGVSMTDQSIIDNLITFLIAGHETTSGTLSFTFYELLKNPRVYRKAQEEVDRVVGKGPIKVEHMSKLPYISAILRETLRLDSPISMISVQPIEDTLLAGKYPVKAGEPCAMLIKKSHIDPRVYGDDALEYKPERMLDENFEKLPKNAWKPFGNGVRGCIGRPFAWQESLLVMAMLLQNFNFVLDDPNYSLVYKQTLTIKPHEFYMRAILRDGLTPTTLERRLAGFGASDDSKAAPSDDASKAGASGDGKPMTILYGSNSGTCEAMARRLAADAPQHGFKASTVDCMDIANGNIPKNQPVIFLTASYEGDPPDNARHLVSYLESINDKSALSDVSYAVFGCGHHDWASTFYRIPKLVDAKLEENGAYRLSATGFADAGESDMFVAFESWEDNVFWPALVKHYGTATDEQTLSQGLSSLKVNVTSPRTSALRTDVRQAEVVATKVLTADGEPIKKHIEIRLPSDSTYRAGDYLAVLPINPQKLISRVMRRFELPWDAHLEIQADSQLPLPTNTSIAASDFFGAYVELSQPATKRNILALAEATEVEEEKIALKSTAGDAYEKEVSEKHVSVLDLLEQYPSVKLPLGSFLAMLPPMRVRQYSISSSPLWKPNNVTLTFSLLEAPSKSGQGVYVGVATSYLNNLQEGDKLHVSVRQSHASFHLPQNMEQTPVICVAAGTGLAPFRGFVQERAALIEAGRKVAPLVLYYGCREPGRDDLYSDELAEWERIGAVSVRRAYSRTPEKSNGNKYVQDALWADRKEIGAMWDNDAKLFVCGSKRVGNAVQEVALRMRQAGAKLQGEELSEDGAKKWWEELRNVRYATDVFD